MDNVDENQVRTEAELSDRNSNLIQFFDDGSACIYGMVVKTFPVAQFCEALDKIKSVYPRGPLIKAENPLNIHFVRFNG